METEERRNTKIKVLVVDDHPIVRIGLRDLLQTSDRIELVGLANDGREAVRVAEQLKPDVIVMDVMMPRNGRFRRVQRDKVYAPRSASRDANGVNRRGRDY